MPPINRTKCFQMICVIKWAPQHYLKLVYPLVLFSQQTVVTWIAYLTWQTFSMVDPEPSEHRKPIQEFTARQVSNPSVLVIAERHY